MEKSPTKILATCLKQLRYSCFPHTVSDEQKGQRTDIPNYKVISNKNLETRNKRTMNYNTANFLILFSITVNVNSNISKCLFLY